MTHQQTRTHSHRTRARGVASLLVVVVFGLLLWAKLLLVTNHPRTAIADPEPAATASAPTPAPAPAPAPAAGAADSVTR